MVGTAFVLADLLTIVRQNVGLELDESSALIEQYWGAAAVPALADELAEARAAGDRSGADKLTALRATLLPSS